MAGVPGSVIERAESKSREMETEKGWIGCVSICRDSQKKVWVVIAFNERYLTVL
jgi:hypothetical protein